MTPVHSCQAQRWGSKRVITLHNENKEAKLEQYECKIGIKQERDEQSLQSVNYNITHAQQ